MTRSTDMAALAALMASGAKKASPASLGSPNQNRAAAAPQSVEVAYRWGTVAASGFTAGQGSPAVSVLFDGDTVASSASILDLDRATRAYPWYVNDRIFCMFVGRRIYAIGGSSSADLEISQPTCVVYATAAQGIGTSGTTISFGSASINVGSMWTSGTNVTIAIPGTYAICGKITYASSGAWTAGKYVQAQTAVNGSGIEFNNFWGPTGTLGTVSVPVAESIQSLHIGDVVTLSGSHNFGGAFNDVPGALYTSLTVRRIGP